MALGTYSDLQTAVANWLNRTDLGSYIPDFIAIAEEVAYQSLRIKAMETAFADTISNGTIGVPADLIELKHAYLNTSPVVPLERKSFEWILTNFPTRSGQGRPGYIARNGSNFEFGPYPDSSYEVRGIYYARLTPLSSSNTANWLTTNAPSILLFGACIAAEQFLNAPDNRLAQWEQLFRNAIQRANMADKREHMSGSVLSMSARSAP